ncbi:site-specific integrase [Rhodococcus sp. LW-XY12]|uniref:site-specific integrase n=1 Tax=Rhodococcus sp. LW-XY12 TaxID=2856851 RepID=UPI001C57957E|nr:site-specific integrase [Rhodococcus sp. LW-XY12]QXU51796.1 site-specific integrase [Rhodococcus sp. LW-XY12]
MTGTAAPDRAVTDPVGSIVDLLAGTDPGFDPVTARQVVTDVAPGRAKARRLALALEARPGLLVDGRSPAPLVVGELLVAARAAGAERIAAPHCTDCERPLNGTLARIGENWYCHTCGRPQEQCAACGNTRPVNRRDRHGRPHCLHCPVPDSRDPDTVLVDVITNCDPSLEATTIITAAALAAPRPTARRRLAWAIEDHPELLTGSGHLAPIPAVLRLIDALCAAGATGIVRPPCPGCGRVTPLNRLRDGQRICRRCSSVGRAVPCSRCGKPREPAGRDDQGLPLCSRCVLTDPANHEDCGGCGRRMPVEARTPEGPFCWNCRPRKQLTCSVCGSHGPAEISQVTGEPWCQACQQRWARCAQCGEVKPIRSGTLETPLCAGCTESGSSLWQPCPRCGTAERLVGNHPCPRCVLDERLGTLLADGTGVIRPELTELHRTLATIDLPRTVLKWLSRSSAAAVLGDLGSGRRALTHDALDDLGPSKPVEHLRSVLVATGALTDRDEHLARLERWLTDTVDTVTDPGHRKLARHYATWQLLRRLRARNRGRPVSYGQATGIRTRLRGAAVLLNWLTDRQLSLSSCTQADIDRWLSDPDTRYRHGGSGFLRWATTSKLVSSSLDGTSRSWRGPAELIDGEQRWDIARRLLHDDTVKPEDRVAGLLVILYAQRASTITSLTTDDVTTRANGLHLKLGSSPVALPEPLSTLVATLVDTRTGHAAIGKRGASPWLFPGGQPGRPLSTAQMGKRLRALGIRPNPARSAALFALAAEVPAAILARTLGIHINVAVDWQQASAGDWTGYAADVGRRPTRNR